MIVVKAFLMSVLSFWRMDLPPEAHNFGDSLEIVRYENGKEISKDIFDKKSPKYQALTVFLNSNIGKWKYDVVSYVPSVEIRSNGITFNCLKAKAIVSYLDANGNPVQLSSDDGSISYCGIK